MLTRCGICAAAIHLWALGWAGAEPIAVVTAVAKPQLDGILVEWGAPERIAIVAGGDRVGLRGAFAGDADHEADVYLMWDATHIYVAVAVVDDIIDVGQIAPGENEWRGPSGERKDMMFYHDHLKVFLRGPERPLGHNLWLAPAEGTPYMWGGIQRGKISERLPVAVGGTLRDGAYTYEMAIPWTWLAFHPRSDMVLDALFLLPDSDAPGQEMRKKVRQSNKWIWWQGKVQLTGHPPGLKEPLKAAVLEEIAAKSREIVVPEVAPKPVPEPVVTEPVSESPATAPAETAAVAEDAPVAETAVAVAGQEQAAPSVAALRSSLNRRLLAREQAVPPAPDWVRALNDDRGVSPAQVDSLYYRLTRTLRRLTAENINTRTDGLVMDMAEYAGTWRAQAQRFLQKLLANIIADGEHLQPRIAVAAAAAGVDGDKAERLVWALCRQTLDVYEGGKVALSESLLDRARRRAKLSADETRALLVALARAGE